MEAENLTQELSDQDRILLVFGYLGPLALVSLVASRKEFVKWHAKQGLAVLTTLAALYLCVLKPLERLSLLYFWGWLAELFSAATWMVLFGAVVLVLVCIVRGLEGERFKLPFVGELTDRARKVIEHTPMKRYGDSMDLIGAVIWLASDASRFVTGTVVPIDGGFSSLSI